MSLRYLPVLAVLLAFLPPAQAQNSFAHQRAELNLPIEPFTVIGNVHYVGTAHVAAYLITSGEGHVLIDGAMEESADQVAANIRRLGFRIEDVRWLLVNHAHWDHAGGLAELKRRSGARLAASVADARDLGQGFNSARDDTARFPPVAVDRRISDGEVVRVGPIALTTHLTPGHTPGCTSWTMRARAGERDYDILFACSLTVANQLLLGDPRYPGAATDFSRTFAALRGLHADVFLGFHDNHFGLVEKRRRQIVGESLAFVDAGELARQVDRAEAAFREELARQCAESPARQSGRLPRC